jgi:hypothetical protein
MKTREEIEAIALEFYPVRLDFHKNDTNQSHRTSFVFGWQLCQKHYEQNMIEMGKEHDTMTEAEAQALEDDRVILFEGDFRVNHCVSDDYRSYIAKDGYVWETRNNGKECYLVKDKASV